MVKYKCSSKFFIATPSSLILQSKFLPSLPTTTIGAYNLESICGGFSTRTVDALWKVRKCKSVKFWYTQWKKLLLPSLPTTTLLELTTLSKYLRSIVRQMLWKVRKCKSVKFQYTQWKKLLHSEH